MRNNKGFTIIELLIAMAAFASMVLVASTTMIQIGRNYYRGLTAIRTQESARNLVASLSEKAQFTKGTVNNVSGADYKAVCIGNVRYTYVTNRVVDHGNTSVNPSEVKHAVWQDEVTSENDCVPVNLNIDSPSANGKSLVDNNMRLAKFEVTQNQDEEIVNISVVTMYGDDDVMEKDGSGQIIGCQVSTVASQWCARSEVSTSAYRRFE